MQYRKGDRHHTNMGRGGGEVGREGWIDGQRVQTRVRGARPTCSKPRGTSVSPGAGGRGLCMLACGRGCVVVVIVPRSAILRQLLGLLLGFAFGLAFARVIAWLQKVETKALPVLCVHGEAVSECLTSTK